MYKICLVFRWNRKMKKKIEYAMIKGENNMLNVKKSYVYLNP